MSEFCPTLDKWIQNSNPREPLCFVVATYEASSTRCCSAPCTSSAATASTWFGHCVAPRWPSTMAQFSREAPTIQQLTTRSALFALLCPAICSGRESEERSAEDCHRQPLNLEFFVDRIRAQVIALALRLESICFVLSLQQNHSPTIA